MRKRLPPRQTRKMQTERTKTRKIGPIRITTTTRPAAVFPPAFLKRRRICIGKRKDGIPRIVHESTKLWDARTGIRNEKRTFTRIGHRMRAKKTTYNPKGKKQS